MNYDKQKYLHSPSTHDAFLKCELADILTMRLENQLLIYLSNKFNRYIQHGDCYISSNCSEKKVCYIFSHPYAHVACIQITYDIPSKRKITNIRFPHWVHTVWLYVHRLVVSGLRPLHNSCPLTVDFNCPLTKLCTVTSIWVKLPFLWTISIIEF